MPTSDPRDASDPPRLPGVPEPAAAALDREAALDLVTRELRRAWHSFDRPRPAEPTLPSDLLARFDEPLPARGSSASQAVTDAARALDASVSPSRPLFVAYIGSTGLEAGVLGEALATAWDVNMAASAGAVEHIEQQTLAWMAEFIGFPMADGIFTSGGMTSNLTAVLAAREQALPGARARGIVPGSAAVYVSSQAHHSVVRAVEVAGLGSRSVRRIPIDAQHRLRPGILDQRLRDDRAAGITPVAVVATGGTTLTGAVDPLDDVAAVCRDHDVWLHVDGAYGAPAAGAPSRRHLFTGLDRADSVTIDAHKWMGVQKACSLLLVARPDALRTAFGHEESYLLHEEDAAHHVDRTLEYSRPVRSLKLWTALRIHGADQYRAWLDHTISLAERLTARLRTAPDFEVLHDPQLTTVCVRHVPAGVADLDHHNAALAAAVTADGRAYVAPAVLDGHVCLRLTLVNFRTTTADLDTLVTAIRECAVDLTGQRGRSK
jgi:aromatic-L-amino-acid decarboxylase